MGLKPFQKWYTLKTKGNSIIFGGCWAYKIGLGIFVRVLRSAIFECPNMDTFAKSRYYLGYRASTQYTVAAAAPTYMPHV